MNKVRCVLGFLVSMVLLSGVNVSAVIAKSAGSDVTIQPGSNIENSEDEVENSKELVSSESSENSEDEVKGSQGILIESDDSKKAYHIGLCKNDIEGATYAILPGDPGRVPLIASYLENSKKIAQNREYTSYLGVCNGQKVLVMSTGIGGPSTAIAVEELSAIGIKNLIRVGTSGGMQMGVNAGDIVIAQAAIREEGTSKEYAPVGFPAVADFDLTLALRDSAQKLGKTYHIGIVHCKDSFYGQHSPERMATALELLTKWEAYLSLGALCSEMETASLYTVASSLKMRAAAVLLVVWNQEQERAGISQDTSFDYSSEIKVAVDAIASLIEKEKNVTKVCKHSRPL